ncbi:hypothetical protein BDP27DRAFT_1436206 [Rhodocollybia butyracea]|uniref:Uncharacterized protein n=1 Tax=Rhodocollybia butyracea TaxID=206335 RepID=A0A9P5P4I4_9AGAR|nr:hypothetical protein BDP27DRAFT_1436206 [Rhodocollybia butyracea]
MAKNLFDSSPANLDTQREYGWRPLDRGGLHHDPKHPESQAAFDARAVGQTTRVSRKPSNTKQSRKRKASPSPATRMAKKPDLRDGRSYYQAVDSEQPTSPPNPSGTQSWPSRTR